MALSIPPLESHVGTINTFELDSSWFASSQGQTTSPNRSLRNDSPAGESHIDGSQSRHDVFELSNDAHESESDDEYLGGLSLEPPRLSLHPLTHDKLMESCQGCKTMNMTGIWWCSICDIMVCDGCWKKQLAHTTDDDRRVQHEKCETELRGLMEWLKPMGNSGSGGTFQVSTKWFGVRIISPTDASLETTSRFNDISMSVVDDKFPSLISFVGETGAGKSTLISALLGVISERS